MKKLLFFAFLVFFVNISSSSAELIYKTQDFRLLNRTYSQFPFVEFFGNGSNTTYNNSNYLEINNTNVSVGELPKYIYTIYCSVVPLTFNTSSVSKGGITDYGYVTGSSCTVNDARGYYYLNRWLINNYSVYTNDVGSNVYGVRWSININNTFGYNVFSRFETIFASNELINDFDNNYLLISIINQNNDLKNELNKTNEKLGDINDSINSSDSSGASSDAGDFFGSFNTDTFGLTSIITSPLNLIKSITNSSCSPLSLPLPFVNKDLTLPCMSSIYQKYFGSFLTLYQTITFGIVAYWVCVRIFNLVKDFKNPEHDEIEVLDL